ncbi:MAG: gliding motility lipoprotein GldB [Chlorobi bacterium]|nr:gliding motility lipoprotein GldB [Chlorobiota bacterium]
MKKSVWIWVAVLLLPWACKKRNPLDVDVSAVPAGVEVIRFDTLFYGGDPARLPALKEEFPYLFSPGIPDSVWAAKMQDTLLLDLRKATDSVFPGPLGVEDRLADVFKHVKYYFPRWKEPRIITLYSDWDYMKKLYLADTLAFLFIDNFLGEDNPVYEGIPLYLRHTMSKEYIPVEFARKTAEHTVPLPRTKDFLSKMIYHGKLLYLQKAFMPRAHDSLLLGYTSAKWRWAVENEKNVWLYFLDQNLLFDTDKNLDMRFLNPSPFSKFYTEVDNESAGMIGRYMGYRIVQAYMDRTGADLQTLIKADPHDIFRESKYKP